MRVTHFTIGADFDSNGAGLKELVLRGKNASALILSAISLDAAEYRLNVQDIGAPETEAKDFIGAFDQRIKKFSGEIFLHRSTGFLLIKKKSSSGEGANEDFLAQNYFWGSIKGGPAYQLYENGSSGSESEYTASFVGGMDIKGKRKKMEVTIWGTTKTLKRVRLGKAAGIESTLAYASLPKVYVPKFLAALPKNYRWPDGSHFYADISKYDPGSEGRRVFIVSPGKKRPLDILLSGGKRNGSKAFFGTPLGEFNLFFDPDRDDKSVFIPAEDSEERVPIAEKDVQKSGPIVDSFGIERGQDVLKVPHF